jgi:hypothetical protein
MVMKPSKYRFTFAKPMEVLSRAVVPGFQHLYPYVFSYDPVTRCHLLSVYERAVHREDGPALIRPEGIELWSQRGHVHRDDGPAWFDDSGARRWLQHGLLHRDDGPAQIGRSGYRTYWLFGVQLNAANHSKLMALDPETRRWVVETSRRENWKPYELGPFVDAAASALLDITPLLEGTAS